MNTRMAGAAREHADAIAEAPIFYPSEEEFDDFVGYVSTVLAPQCAVHGICKVVPPAGWRGPSPQRQAGREAGFTIRSPIEQHVVGCQGLYQIFNEERLRMTLERFERQAVAIEAREAVSCLGEDEAVERFWKEIATARAPLYGSDLEGSFFPPPIDLRRWNLRALPDLLRLGPAALPTELKGINSPMLYMGRWRTLFPLHAEDMDLFSINYLHSGATKQWYGISPRSADHVELLAAQCFPRLHSTCRQFLRHKASLIAPEVFIANGVALSSLRQRAGTPRAHLIVYSIGSPVASEPTPLHPAPLHPAPPHPVHAIPRRLIPSHPVVSYPRPFIPPHAAPYRSDDIPPDPVQAGSCPILPDPARSCPISNRLNCLHPIGLCLSLTTPLSPM